MSDAPWVLNWKLKEPDEKGRKKRSENYASEGVARHTWKQLVDSGRCVSVTLINDTLSCVRNRIVAEWPPRGKRKHR